MTERKEAIIAKLLEVRKDLEEELQGDYDEREDIFCLLSALIDQITKYSNKIAGN